MDARQGGELLVPQGHIVIQVGRDDAEQVVGVAEQSLGVADLRYRDERGFENGNGAGVLDPRLIVLGATGVTASLLVLARVARPRAPRVRTAELTQMPAG